MIQTYFGNGKGKTTAAVGSAIRFAGCENKVLYAEFLKNNASSELTILKCMKNVEVLSSDECYNLFDNLKEERTKDLTCAYTKLLQCVKEKANSVKMIVLDEVLDALDFNYLDEDEFLSFISAYKNDCEIILTGHKLTPKIADVSDYISEVKETKHPYSKGGSPRKGIEF